MAIETAEQKLARERAEEEVRVVQRFFARHQDDYWSTQKNSDAIERWLKVARLSFNDQSVQTAFDSLRAQGWNFLADKPKPAVDAASLPGVNSLPPEICAKLTTKADIRALPAETIRKWMRIYGPEIIDSRMREIQRRGV